MKHVGISLGFLFSAYLCALPKGILLNWENPTVEDLRTVQEFLDNEQLMIATGSYGFRTEKIKGFRLFDPSILPVLQIEKGANREQCIICYCSINNAYQMKLQRLIESIKRVGFEGDIIYRIGGWPNMEAGGIILCDTPYAFKVSAFEEALRLGYKQVLWLDLSVVVLSDIKAVFEKIKADGAYFRKSFFVFEREDVITSELAEAYNMSLNELKSFPHYAAGVLGFDLERPNVQKLIEDWHNLAVQKNPFQSCFPEQVPLSVLIDRYDLHKGLCEYEEIVFTEEQVTEKTRFLIKY